MLEIPTIPKIPVPASEAVDFDYTGHSEAGPVRERNEDAWMGMGATDAVQAGLFAVCDGMGGHNAGDYASSYIVDCLKQLEAFRHHGAEIQAISGCLAGCNQHLADYARTRGFDVVGSTAVILHLGFRRATVLWVGDSRAYRLRNHVLQQVTRDHVLDPGRGSGLSEVNDQLSQCGAITRAVGGDRTLEIDRLCLDVEPGDVWLLCSDGVSGSLTEQQILEALDADTPLHSRKLVQKAISCGSRDNCTAVIVRINPVVAKISPVFGSCRLV